MNSIRTTLALLCCLLVLPGTQAQADQTAYTFAVVPQFEQRQLFAVWKPILNELENRTGLQFRMVGTPTIPSFEQQFMAGQFDFAYMNPYHALTAIQAREYLPLVRDDSLLQGILMVRQDSPIRSVEQLRGHVIAFPAPNALGASLMIRADLERQFGLTYTPLYVQTHTSVYLHILQGLASAGGGVNKSLQQQVPAIRDNLRTIHTTEAVPTHPVVAHRRIPENHRTRVRQALLEMGRSETGRRLLKDVPMPSPIPTTEEDFLSLLKLDLAPWEENAEHGKVR